MTAQVWLDDLIIGHHVGGYTSFAVELPRPSGRLRVAVDNSPDANLIPSDMSDFFLYGGLTRNVWHYHTGPVRLVQLQATVDWSVDTAVVTLQGACDAVVPGTELNLQLAGPDGTAVWESSHRIDTPIFTIAGPPIARPQRWSPANPALYALTAQIVCQGELSDNVVDHIGFRTFDFPEGGPFYLNGERLLLRGTHRHEDWAGMGSAVSDELNRQELMQIKAAGFNFVRLGHYPQADAVLDACDELGLIVWEELPWCRGGVGGELFKTRARTIFQEMVAQHYNRPSILFWGLGNELDWASEHPDTTDDDVFDFLVELHDLSHQLDPSRLTALRRYDRGAAVVDVYAPSIWSGWYRGRYEDYEMVLRDAMARFPRLLHAEWGGDSHVGRHNSGPHLRRAIAHHLTHEENPDVALSTAGEARASLDSDWSESYVLDLMEWHLQVQNRLPDLAGTAQWVFKDFGTPLRPENPIPFVNQKGLVDRNGRPKDLYYLFQAYQTSNPVCYIESPTWPLRSGEPGELKRIRVYSNCERVELFVNGRSQGTKFLNPKVFPARGLVWFVALYHGKNQIRAVGVCEDGTHAEHALEQILIARGKDQAVALQGKLEPVRGSDETAVRASVQLISHNGIPMTNHERRLHFRLRGPGQLVCNQGTADGSYIVDTANGRASIIIIGFAPSSTLHVTANALPAIELTYPARPYSVP